MNIEFGQPSWLIGLVLAVIPLLIPFQRSIPYPWLALVPEDPLSKVVNTLVRLVAAIALAVIVTGLAQPHRKGQLVEKIGTGAHIVLLLDRSASMNENFSGQRLGGRSFESKGHYAQKLLAEFVRQSEHDLFAMASFNTSAIYTLALTQDRTAILSALKSAGRKGRGITNMAAGLSMALNFFTDQPMTGSRVILLVSDGATRIDQDTQERLRQWFYATKVSLYWIYLRNPNHLKLTDRPKNPNENTTPEYFLHQFFSQLDIPYTAFEADSPDAVKQAINQIQQLENKPIVYHEKVLRIDWSGYCYGTAALLLSFLLLMKCMEIKEW